MDFRSLKSKLNKRPEEWHSVGDYEFLIRLPQKTRLNELVSESARDGKIDQSAFLRMSRPLCENFVTDWRGVKVKDMAIGWDLPADVDLEEPVDFSPQALSVYLDDHTEEMADIAAAAISMWEKRNSHEVQEKKSSKST